MPEETVEQQQPLSVDGGEREALYKQYQDGTAPAKAEEKPVETKPETKQEEKAESKEKTKPETAEKKHEDEGEKEKVVPYNALKEEREKRKAIAQRAKELEERVARYEAAKAAPVTEQTDDEAILDYEAELKAIKKQNREILDWAKESKTKEQIKTQAEFHRNLQDRVTNTAKKLEEEGYPGFSLLVPKVTEALVELVREDPENAYLDTPDGWMKIYKERVFPQARETFKSLERKADEDKKKELKKQAGLVTSSGRVEKQKSEEPDMSFQAYLKRRNGVT